MEFAISQNFCAQPRVFLEKFFRPRGDGDIHPFAGSAMLCSSKLHALNFELTTDQRKEIDSGNDDVTAQDACRFLPDSKAGAKPLENLR